MKTKRKNQLYVAIVMLFTLATAKSYAFSYTISFTASGATTTVGSVEVKNLTKGTTVTVPNGNTLTLTDVTTAMDLLSIEDRTLKVIQNASTGVSTIKFYATQSGSTQVSAFTIDGRKIVGQNFTIEEGVNALELTLPKGVFVVRVTGQGYDYTSKMLNSISANKLAEIKFLSNSKIEGSKIQKSKTTPIQTTTMTYTTGDKLLYTATSTTFVSSVPDVPTGGKIVNFNFAVLPTSIIPAGTFTMGSPLAEPYRDQETQHQVTLSSFRISKYEITNAQFVEFLNARAIGIDRKYALGFYPSELLMASLGGSMRLDFIGNQWICKTGYENHPIVNVSWYGAREYASYIGGYLPTEAQWEYACRAGTTTTFNTGNCLNNLQAKYLWTEHYYNCPGNSTTAWTLNTDVIGSYPSNAWGLYDMHGNASELCNDWFDLYSTASQTNPTGPPATTSRVLRGGGLASYARECRSAQRQPCSPDVTDGGIGFRVVFLP